MSGSLLLSAAAGVQPRAAARGAERCAARSPRMCAALGLASARRSDSRILRSSSWCPSVDRLAAPRGRAVSHSPPSTIATPLRVLCANPRRVAKVQQQMRREISNMLQTDKVSLPSATNKWTGVLLRGSPKP